MVTRRKRWLGSIAAGALVLAGCGGVEPDATYENADDLVDAAIASGYECPNRAVKDTPPRDDAAPSIGCLSDNRDQFIVYVSPQAAEADRESAILGAQSVMAVKRVDQAVLAGPNWSIRGPVDEIESLQDDLGGFMPDLSDVRMP